jgi:hypothetical protein
VKKGEVHEILTGGASYKGLGITVLERIYECGMVFRINRIYLLNQDWPSGIRKGEVLCFLLGTDWAFER